jgi:hypothetical protein
LIPSSGLGDLSGFVGRPVVSHMPSGLVLRKRPTYERPTSPGAGGVVGAAGGVADRGGLDGRAWGMVVLDRMEVEL